MTLQRCADLESVHRFWPRIRCQSASTTREKYWIGVCPRPHWINLPLVINTKVDHYAPRPIADYNLPLPVLPCYAHLNTHHFYLFLNFIRKKFTHHKTGYASVHIRKLRHKTRSMSIHVRKISCESGSADWRIRSLHISVALWQREGRRALATPNFLQSKNFLLVKKFVRKNCG